MIDRREVLLEELKNAFHKLFALAEKHAKTPGELLASADYATLAEMQLASEEMNEILYNLFGDPPKVQHIKECDLD